MFTQEEISMLLRGLDAIEKSDSMAHAMSGMVGAMLCKDEESKAKWQAEEEKAAKAREEKTRQLQKQIIKLKAKILDIEPVCVAIDFV